MSDILKAIEEEMAVREATITQLRDQISALESNLNNARAKEKNAVASRNLLRDRVNSLKKQVSYYKEKAGE